MPTWRGLGPDVTRQHALTTVTLPAGIVDLSRHIPSEDKTLLASATNLVIRRDLNPTMGRSMIFRLVAPELARRHLLQAFFLPQLRSNRSAGAEGIRRFL